MNLERVLHVVTYMGRGGLETMLMNYYRHIDRLKVQFDFLVHREFIADYDEEILSMGGKIYRLPYLNPFDGNYSKKLNFFFKEHPEYLIIHSHLDCMAGIPLKYAKKHGIPVRIGHAHSSNQTKDQKYFIKLLFKRNIGNYATQLFACSKAAGEWMFNGQSFHVMNNAVETSNYAYSPQKSKEVRARLGIAVDTLVIGHVGRFAPPKNHSFLISVFNELLKEESDSKLLLVGAGDLMDTAKGQVNMLGIEDKVIFTGLTKDVAELMQAMDVFVFPSIYEGLPLTIVEAQAAGLPCITSDRVPIECKITDLVYQMKLEDSISEWVKLILQCAKEERKNTFENICKAGFDIENNAEWLCNYYCKCLN